MRFLVADDDPALGMFLSRGLEAEGHTVRLASDGQHAVETFLNEMPDTLAYDLGSAVNTANAAGSDANGNPGAAILT